MRELYIDVKEEKGKLNRYFTKSIGAGRAAEVMRYSAFEQLKMIQRTCPFEYIRFHGIFHEEMNVVKRNADGTLQFNFQYVDLLFDELLKIGLRPIVELGLTPDVMASEKKYVFWWNMNISMPKALEEWSLLVENTVRHFTIRYGAEEVKKWYFEVWNEPNYPAFFTEYKTPNAYFKLYESAALAIKRVCPDYKVGGPATSALEWIPQTIEFCENNRLPLDFISSHNYCVKGAFDADGEAKLYVQPIEFMTDGICQMGEFCHQKGYPFLLTEWSSSYSSRDSIHDSYYSAPFVLETIKRCEGKADMLCYWVYTDIFEEVAPPFSPFHGGFGMLNIQSLPKPSYYAYTFLHRLGDIQLQCNDTSAYACKSNQELQILFWNLVHPDGQDVDNQQYFARLLKPKAIEPAKVVISGLESNKPYVVYLEKIGYKSGDVYSAYLESGASELSTLDITERLKKCAKPKKRKLHVVSNGEGQVELVLPQTENQVDLLTIRF